MTAESFFRLKVNLNHPKDSRIQLFFFSVALSCLNQVVEVAPIRFTCRYMCTPK